MIRPKFACFAAISMAASAALANQPQLVPYKQTPQGELKLHLFLPEPAEDAPPRPAIVFFFGGGWTNGSPEQFYPHAKHIADLGMVAAAAEYRIKSKHGTAPDASVEDAKSAVRWLRAHAEAYNIDSDRIVASGGSAGGHIAACTAYINGFDAEDEDTNVSSVPNATILFNPAVDVTQHEERAGRFLGKAEALSPTLHIESGAPPAVIFHGTDDKPVPIETVELFTEKMKAAGNDCELAAYEGMGHGFFNASRDNGVYEKTLVQCEAFLKNHGFLVD